MKEKITQFLKDRYVSDVGFSKCEDSPFAGLTNCISMVFRLSDAIVDQIDGAPTHTYFHHYRTMNANIDRIGLEAVMMLQSLGYNAAQIPASQSVSEMAGLFSHKMAAVRAGLGSIGKSALFLSSKFGPRVRLGTIFTDAPIECENHIQTDICKDCNICASACGAMAIKNINFKQGMSREDIFDAYACSEYMKEKYKHIGRGAVCGVCMQVCPKGKFGLDN